MFCMSDLSTGTIKLDLVLDPVVKVIRGISVLHRLVPVHIVCPPFLKPSKKWLLTPILLKYVQMFIFPTHSVGFSYFRLKRNISLLNWCGSRWKLNLHIPPHTTWQLPRTGSCQLRVPTMREGMTFGL